MGETVEVLNLALLSNNGGSCAGPFSCLWVAGIRFYKGEMSPLWRCQWGPCTAISCPPWPCRGRSVVPFSSTFSNIILTWTLTWIYLPLNSAQTLMCVHIQICLRHYMCVCSVTICRNLHKWVCVVVCTDNCQVNIWLGLHTKNKAFLWTFYLWNWQHWAWANFKCKIHQIITIIKMCPTPDAPSNLLLDRKTQ